MIARLLGWIAIGLWLASLPASAQDAAARSAAEIMDILMWNREPVGGPFELIDHTGRRRTDQDFSGKLMLVYFGFTLCPDVCPTDLQAITVAMDKLGTAADGIQPLFVTVDPERDTPEHLADYLSSFSPRLIGLTGSREAVRRAADAYKVYYARIPPEKAGADYTVDHSAFIYLMDRDGRYLGFFPPGTTPDRLADVIRPHLAPPAR